MRCIKEDGRHVFLNDTSRLSGVHLADVTQKSIDGSPSGNMHQNTHSGYVPLPLLISCWPAEPWLPRLSSFPLKKNPRPENELLIVAPMGRARPYNVCKLIYVPTVTGTRTNTHMFASCGGEAAALRQSWPAAVVVYSWFVFVRLFFFYLHYTVSEITPIIIIPWAFFLQRNCNPDSFYPEILPFLTRLPSRTQKWLCFSAFFFFFLQMDLVPSSQRESCAG